MHLCCPSLVPSLAGGQGQAVKFSAGWDLGVQSPTGLWPKGERSTPKASAAGDSGSAHCQHTRPRDDARHKTCTALCLEARLRRHASGTACTCGWVTASAAASLGERRELHVPRAVAAQNSPWENTFPPQGDHWSCQVPPSLCCHWPHCPPSRPV